MQVQATRGRFYLGLPVWACSAWRGSLYTRDAPRAAWLRQYAQVFAAVEGNATFYALPSLQHVRQWAAAVPESFRFCFKFPRTITHERKLRDTAALCAEFLARLEPLRGRLGPLLLQLGPNFGAADLEALDAFLAALGNAQRIAVEVRHPDFFDGGLRERALEALLGARGALRGNFDTVDVHAAFAEDATTALAQARKPRLPRRASCLGDTAFVRFVGRNRIADCAVALGFWVEQVTHWLASGKDVYFFTHTPDDAHAPALAQRFHELLAARDPQLGPLPAFPGLRSAAAGPKQEALF